jgi:hypothetical protein
MIFEHSIFESVCELIILLLEIDNNIEGEPMYTNGKTTISIGIIL